MLGKSLSFICTKGDANCWISHGAIDADSNPRISIGKDYNAAYRVQIVVSNVRFLGEAGVDQDVDVA